MNFSDDSYQSRYFYRKNFNKTDKITFAGALVFQKIKKKRNFIG